MCIFLYGDICNLSSENSNRFNHISVYKKKKNLTVKLSSFPALMTCRLISLNTSRWRVEVLSLRL